MASYRFCRTDDLPLLARAHNVCCRPHDPALPEYSTEGLKQAGREIDLWASSCMVAQVGDDPVGVVLACKRPDETLIWRVGVRPDELRRGHARHLMTSLSAKLAILGPPKLVAEIPPGQTELTAFFEACGYEPELEYADFLLDAPTRPAEASELVIPVTVDELVANEALASEPGRCWRRASSSLIQRRADLQGLAVASAERIEAYLLHDADEGGERRLQALGCADPARREVWLGLLLRQFVSADPRPVRLERAHPGELPFELLESWGFEPAGTSAVRFACRPEPA